MNKPRRCFVAESKGWTSIGWDERFSNWVGKNPKDRIGPVQSIPAEWDNE